MAKALLHELGKSLSFGRLSLRAKVLWPMLLATSDDQGRGTAEPDAIKWYVCPNVPEITIDDVPSLMQEMQDQGMIHLYQCDRGCLTYQIVRWWEYQSLRWARPSKFSAPDGWSDRIRYSDRGDITIDNWDGPCGFSGPPPTENYTENYPDNQPNLTQPNSTERNVASATTPTPGNGKRQPTPAMKEWRRLYQDLFDRDDLAELLDVEGEVGSDATIRAIQWAYNHDPRITSMTAICTTARRCQADATGPPPTPVPKEPQILHTNLDATPAWMSG
jgi:hypothetical protein